MSSILIRNATIVNEGRSFKGDLLVKDEIISAISSPGETEQPSDAIIINAQ